MSAQRIAGRLPSAGARISVRAMGMFKDMRDLSKMGKEMQQASGRPTGLKGMKSMLSEANQMMGDLQQQQADAQRLMATGIVGSGQIVAIRDTGMTINENPQVELDINVTIPNVPLYGVTHKQVINRIHIPQFQPGTQVPVRVDPADYTKILIA